MNNKCNRLLRYNKSTGFHRKIENEKLAVKIIMMIDVFEQVGIFIKGPYVKHINNGIYELRIKHGSDIARIFYFYDSNRIILTNSYIKKKIDCRKETLKRHCHIELNITKGKIMKTITHSEAKKILFKNNKLKNEYESMQSDYEFLVQLHKARIANNLT